MTGLLLELPPQHAQLAAPLVTRKLLPVTFGDQRPVVVKLRHVQLAKSLHDAGVSGAVELGKRGALPKGLVQPGAVAGVFEELRELPGSVVPRSRGLGHLRDPRLRSLPLELVEAHHIVGRRDPVVGAPQPGAQVAVRALVQCLAGLDAIGAQFHDGSQRTQSLTERLHRALAGVGGRFQVAGLGWGVGGRAGRATGQAVKQVVDVRVDEPAGHIVVKAHEPVRGVRKAPVRVGAIAQRERGEEPRHEVVRFGDAAEQSPGLEDRVHELDLLCDSVGRLAAAESAHPAACITERPREEAPPLVAVGSQRLARVQHVLVPRLGYEDAVVLRPDLGVAAGGTRDLPDACGLGRPTGVAVIRPQQRRSFRRTARGMDRPLQIFALQPPKHRVTAKRLAERVRILLQTPDCSGRLGDEFADRVHVGGDEVKPAARPPRMPARDADRRDQFLHLADQCAAAREVLGGPRHRAPDRESPALDGQPVHPQPRQAADQLVRGQFALRDRGVDRAGIVVQAFAALFEEHAVFGAAVRCGAAQRQSALQLVEHRALVGLVAVELEARVAQVDGVEAALHDLQRGHLLGDEEDRLAAGERLADQVGDGLRLARPRRSLDDQVAAVHGV